MTRVSGHSILLACVWATLALSCPAYPELITSRLFTDHAVLQHGREVPVWGRAAPGDKVTVAFAGQQVEAIADEEGAWTAVLKPLDISREGRPMTIRSKLSGQRVLEDILVGDVWVCSGQSNMGFPLKSSLDSVRFFANPDMLIRFFQPQTEFYPYPLERFKSPVQWELPEGDGFGWKSAVACYFAEAIREKVDIPIGLHIAARGGTMIHPFMPAEAHAEFPDSLADQDVLKLQRALALRDPALPDARKSYLSGLQEMDRWLDHLGKSIQNEEPFSPMPPMPGVTGSDETLCGLYNTFFAPMERFPVRGMIWYQGESNGGDGQKYIWLLEAFIRSMRAKLNGGGDFPFYVVQLANYGKDKNEPGLGDGNVGVREAQREVAATMTNCGLAVTHDIGNPDDVHPKNKSDVGKRLARWALNRDYGFEDVLVSGPLFQRQEIDKEKIVLHFDYTGSGLMAGTKDGTNEVVEVDAPPERFEIAGEDKKFVWADARIAGDTVVVSSPDVPEPRYVRYAYSASPVGKLLYNREGLPASPFKTDPW